MSHLLCVFPPPAHTLLPQLFELEDVRNRIFLLQIFPLVVFCRWFEIQVEFILFYLFLWNSCTKRPTSQSVSTFVFIWVWVPLMKKQNVFH